MSYSRKNGRNIKDKYEKKKKKIEAERKTVKKRKTVRNSES